MQKKTNTLYYVTAVILAVLLFLLFRIFPLTGDDWFREGLGASLHSVQDLVRTVAQKWSTSNGRILGNVLAYTAGSRPIVRDVLRAGILLLLVVWLSRITKQWTASGLLLCTALVLFLPSTMFREVYPWAAGYFNYVPPVALALLALCLIPELWAGKPAGNSIKRSIALFFVAFSAQLFVENVTFYVVCSAAALNIYQCVRYRKCSAELLCYLIGSIMGAALLLASPSYLDIFSGGKTTRSVLRTVCADCSRRHAITAGLCFTPCWRIARSSICPSPPCSVHTFCARRSRPRQRKSDLFFWLAAALLFCSERGLIG